MYATSLWYRRHGRRVGLMTPARGFVIAGLIAAVFTGTALLASLYNIENVLFRLGWRPTGTEWRLTTLPNILLPA